jgi:predicted nucleic acid-binding protein
MSADRYTLDTNVLVYAVERSEGWKHELAVEIVNRSIDRPCVLTLQALAEFVAVISRKRIDERPFAIGQARDWLSLFPVTAATRHAFTAALGAFEAGQVALWDALLLATAKEAGCTIALSENMHDGGTLLGMTIRNPFRAGGPAKDLQALLGVL